jgi:error-prone DNA polymerase
VKFDLLGLGMLTVLHDCIDLIAANGGSRIDLAEIPQDPAVYEMLQAADSIGVFQVESRAQMATLPRLKPRTFYDLVVEVALIRPGPIQGGSVHPYIRRRNGLEPVTYLHPLLEKSLAKTLGVPLFQEQLMQMAIDVAGFSPGEADQLRQAMGSKRSTERMERLRGRFYEGMAANGITGEVADRIFEKLAAFANFGFPESHSVSFAYLVYASSWLKLHHPAAFCAALLNAQPMGFWAPHTLVRDARRHGVQVRRPDVNISLATSSLEPCERSTGGLAVRLGLGEVRSVGEALAERIAARRLADGPYASVEDLVRRAEVPLPAVEALATASALSSLGLDRRRALWAAGAAVQARPDRLEGIVTGTVAPALPGMSATEETTADLWSTGIADVHPTEHLREHLSALGVLTAEQLRTAEVDRRVLVGGVVTHRQKPATAQGTIFVNLEDETGLVNVICSAGVWDRHRAVARTSPALLVRGTLERVEGVINVVADRLEALPLTAPTRSRDFR